MGVSEFMVPGDQTYRVLVLAVDTDWHNGAGISLSENLANSDNYILELAGEELPLSSSNGSNGEYFPWSTSWLAMNAPTLDADTYETTLPLDGEVTVCLRTTTQVCPGGGTLSGLALTPRLTTTLVVNDGTTDRLSSTYATTPYTAECGATAWRKSPSS